MSTQTVSIVAGVIILIFGVGYLVTATNEKSNVATNESATEVAPRNEISATEVDINDESVTPSPATTDNVATGVYATYDATVIAGSDAEHILLFFKASWCPSCRALDADIIANASNIPAGVEIYTVDYDTATALKRQYGVTTQHSIIEISADGTAQSGISHGLTLADVLATI